MKKLASIVLSLSFLSATALGAEWGFKAGPSFSRFLFSEGLGRDWRPLPSFQAGVFLGLRIFGHTVLRPEILFSRLGGTFASAYAGKEVRVRERLDYLVLPVLLKFEIPVIRDLSLRFCGGGYGAALIGAKTVLEFDGESYKDDIRKEIKPFDYGFCLGLEAGWKNFLLEFRANRGLADIKKRHLQSYAIYLSDWTVLLGYRF